MDDNKLPDDNEEVRDAIDRIEQEVNEVGITHDAQERYDVNIIDVLNVNCKNIIALDTMVKTMFELVNTHQRILKATDDDLQKTKAALRKHRKTDKIIWTVMYLILIIFSVTNIINLMH